MIKYLSLSGHWKRASAERQGFAYLQRRQMTLLELIISLSLTLIILSILTYFYQQVNVINAEMDRTQNASFQKRYVESRLASVLPRAISSTDKSGDFHFFSSPDPGGLFKEGSTSLVFTFDNCVQFNKNMAYHVIGRIYLDKKGNLTLAIWPAEKRWKENAPPSDEQGDFIRAGRRGGI